MPAKRRSFWGTAIGLDQSGAKRRISIFETANGFRFVDENLDSVSSQSPSADHIGADVATVFGLRNVKLELPHLGIYSSSKTPISTAPAKPLLAPKAGPAAWGNVLKTRKPRR